MAYLLDAFALTPAPSSILHLCFLFAFCLIDLCLHVQIYLLCFYLLYMSSPFPWLAFSPLCTVILQALVMRLKKKLGEHHLQMLCIFFNGSFSLFLFHLPPYFPSNQTMPYPYSSSWFCPLLQALEIARRAPPPKALRLGSFYDYFSMDPYLGCFWFFSFLTFFPSLLI